VGEIPILYPYSPLSKTNEWQERKRNKRKERAKRAKDKILVISSDVLRWYHDLRFQLVVIRPYDNIIDSSF
jgi:hypothetical protein